MCFFCFWFHVKQHMWDQERDHLKVFSKLMVDRRVRPTVLLPIWNVAGYALGMYS